MLAAKEARKKELADKAAKVEDIAELRSINSEILALNDELAELRSMIADAEKKEAGEQKSQKEEGKEFRSEQPVEPNVIPEGLLRVLGTYAADEKRSKTSEDYFASVEYRKAFAEFAKTGKVTQELRMGDQPADTFTSTDDVSAVIPTTILNEIIEKLEVYGHIFKRVRKLNIQGGVQVPILTLRPVARWIGEDTPSERQKAQANQSVSFNYYGLEVKLAQSLLAQTVSLSMFEGQLTELVVEAMVIAIDKAVISGKGGTSGQALGITEDGRIPKKQVIELTSEEFQSWNGWKRKVFAKMPLAYKGGAVFVMASGTFEGYIDGMVDTTGQPIGRVNHGITDGPQERFGGKEVILVEDDVIANYDDADKGDVVAIYGNLRNYAFNSNLSMRLYRYMDHDTNQWVNKAILIGDGKVLDPNGFVIIKKGAEVVNP